MNRITDPVRLQEKTVAAMPADAQPEPAVTPAFGAGAAPTPRAEFIALTSSDELLEQLGQALDGDSAIRHCETLDGLAAHLSAKRAHVVMIDAREHDELVGVVERVQLLADSCIVVVFAPAEQIAGIATAVRRSAAFAVLPIPVETDKTAAVLEGARDEALSRLVIAAPQVRADSVPQPRATIAEPMSPESTLSSQFASDTGSNPVREALPRQTRPGPVRVAGTTGRRPPRALLLGAIVLAAVALAAVRVATRDRTDGYPDTASRSVIPAEPLPLAPGVTSNVPTSVATQDGSLEELLIKAQAAFRNRRYAPPEADNALTYYQSVLAQQPDNGEALEGLQRIRSVLVARLQAALDGRSLEEAESALRQLALIDGTDPALAAMETQVVELRVSSALETGDLDRAGQLLREAKLTGKLPPDRAANLRTDLERRQAEARNQRQLAEAAQRYAELRTPKPSSVPAASVTRKAGATDDAVDSDPTRDSHGAGTAAAENSFSSGPGPAAASPPASAAGSAQFKRTRYVEPVYPKDALEKGIRGDVRVRITVDTDGRVKDAEVLSSSPPGVFEKSALSAVRRWRFKPIEVDGKEIEASATTTVVFQPKQ